MDINQAYNLADVRTDAGDKDAAEAINFCAGTGGATRQMAGHRLAFAMQAQERGQEAGNPDSRHDGAGRARRKQRKTAMFASQKNIALSRFSA